MPRSLKLMAANVFEKFDNFASLRGFKASSSLRYLNYSPDDIPFAAHANLLNDRFIYISPSEMISLAELDNHIYIFDIGSNMDISNTNISELYIKAGHTLFLFNFIKPSVPIDQRIDSIRDRITEYDNTLPNYEGHDYTALLDSISPTKLYCLDSTKFVFKLEILISLYNNWVNFDDSLSNITKSELKKLIEMEIIYNSFSKNIFSLLISENYETIFLSLYRCFEPIMNIGYYNKSKGLGFSGTYIQFLDMIEDTIGIRPREIDALESIFELYSHTSEALKVIADRIPKCSQHTPNHKIFYSLRNTLIHGKSDIFSLHIRPEEWNDVILFTILTLKSIIESLPDDILE